MARTPVYISGTETLNLDKYYYIECRVPVGIAYVHGKVIKDIKQYAFGKISSYIEQFNGVYRDRLRLEKGVYFKTSVIFAGKSLDGSPLSQFSFDLNWLNWFGIEDVDLGTMYYMEGSNNINDGFPSAIPFSVLTTANALTKLIVFAGLGLLAFWLYKKIFKKRR